MTKLLHLSCAMGSQCKIQREGFDAFEITLLSMLWEQQFPSTKSFMQYSKQFLGPRSYENLRKTWTWRKHEWNCLVNKEGINKYSYWRLRISMSIPKPTPWPYTSNYNGSTVIDSSICLLQPTNKRWGLLKFSSSLLFFIQKAGHFCGIL